LFHNEKPTDAELAFLPKAFCYTELEKFTASIQIFIIAFHFLLVF
jgi:hypothetical protein